MKLLSALCFILISMTSLQAKCHLHEVIGHLDIVEQEIILKISQGTQSEVKLTLSSNHLMEVAPFIDRDIKTNIILSTKEIYNNTKILRITNSQLTIPDPLNDVALVTKKYIKEVKCP